MSPSLFDARKAIVFPKTAMDFRTNAAGLLKELRDDVSSETAVLARELCLDLGSQMRRWNLDGLIRGGDLDAADVEAVAAQLAGIAERHDSREETLSLAREEDKVGNSQTGKICAAADEGRLATYWGHDYCTGMDFSLRRGARFVTSNPAR
ncbi:MAG: hypothetical protein LBU23_04990 [Planctomycetota bacterium]|jgi:hypothetical protein|nr:hypothetical protein [Planctomycetota bacterium]